MQDLVARAETRCHTRLSGGLLERESEAADCAPERDSSFASPLPSARRLSVNKSAKRPSYASELGGSLLEEELTDALRGIQASVRKQRQERDSRGPMGFGLLPAVSSLLASSSTPIKDKSGAHAHTPAPAHSTPM
jgi:hypothetical protein